jgi:hypothetical protein
MKNIPLFISLLFLINTSLAQSGSIKGKVIDEQSQKMIESPLSVSLGGNSSFSISTDQNGYFEFSDIPEGSYTLTVSGYIYSSYSVEVQIKANEMIDLGTIQVKQNSAFEENFETTLTIIQSGELDDDGNGGNGLPNLLFSSRDAYLSVASFTLGSARFRVRGLDNQYAVVGFNNITMNDMDRGNAYWSAWGGLNDVTRFMQTTSGLQNNDFGFGNVGGSTNIQIRPSNAAKGTRATLSYSNRSYAYRTMVTHNTGLMKNNWAFTTSASWRYANSGYVEGTFYDSWAFFISAEKKFNNKHSLSLTAYAAPLKRGNQTAAVQEVYDILGNNYYNPYWGMQGDNVRNSRTVETARPTFFATHHYQINDKTKLTTTAMGMYGYDKRSALWWFDAPDPRPDYYRYLPSFHQLNGNNEAAQVATENWQNNELIRQINWDKIYQINYNNENGRASYITENRMTDMRQFSFASVLNTRINDNLNVDAGVNLQLFRSNTYKTVRDLLGANYWLDVDLFAERDFPTDPLRSQNDLNNPNRQIGEGDRFGYDYNSSINLMSGFAQARYKLKRFEFTATTSLSTTSMWRTGNMRNGNHPNNSEGDSDILTFNNYALKGGILYKIDGRNYLQAMASTQTRAPLFMNSFVSPRVRNQVVPNLTNETINAAELSFIHRSPKLKARITGYYIGIEDQVWVRSFYHDGFRNLVNFVMTGVDKQHMGLEMGFDLQLTSTLSAIGAANFGQYIYSNRPDFLIIKDNEARPLERGTAYLENYRIDGTPQTAGSLGLRYNAPKFWFVGGNANYFANNYVGINPSRRTIEGVRGVPIGSQLWSDVLEQERLPNAITMDIYGGKSFKYKNYIIGINLNITNVLNNQQFITSGFEQLRYDQQGADTQINRFPNKYFYYFGRTYFVNLTLRF